MRKNIGYTDQALRIVAGVSFLALPFWFSDSSMALIIGSIGVGLGLIGTALFTLCPIYTVLGISTSQE